MLSNLIGAVTGAVADALDPDARAERNLEARAGRLALARADAEAALAAAGIAAAALDNQDDRRGARKGLSAEIEALEKARAAEEANRLALDTVRARRADRQRAEAEREAAEIEAARRTHLAECARKLLEAARAADVAAEAVANVHLDTEDAWALLLNELNSGDLNADQRGDLSHRCSPSMFAWLVGERAKAIVRQRRSAGDPDAPLPSAEAALMGRDGFAALLNEAAQ
jgi:hypothetical protein